MPVRTILAVFCPWPKTLQDFLMPDSYFTGTLFGSLGLAADGSGQNGIIRFYPESRLALAGSSAVR